MTYNCNIIIATVEHVNLWDVYHLWNVSLTDLTCIEVCFPGVVSYDCTCNFKLSWYDRPFCRSYWIIVTKCVFNINNKLICYNFYDVYMCSWSTELVLCSWHRSLYYLLTAPLFPQIQWCYKQTSQLCILLTISVSLSFTADLCFLYFCICIDHRKI